MKKIIIALIVGILLISVISAGYSIINSENNTHTNPTLKKQHSLDTNLSADSNDTINLENNKLIKNLIQ